jgi:membrane complex biogenesis BtpA family protein
VSAFRNVFTMPRPLVAVVHLPPSIGCAGCPGMEEASRLLARDIAPLDGYDGVLLENDDDKPHAIEVPPAQARWLEAMARLARARCRVPLGINVQRADWKAALAIAAAVGLEFVRLDVFVDAVRMEGQLVTVDPAAVRAHRAALAIEHVLLLTDVHVKHAELVGGEEIGASARRAVAEGSDAVLVTGSRTGEAPAIEDLRAAAAGVPVLVGSGLTAENASALAPFCDGALVGTALKRAGRVDRERARAVVAAWRSVKE